MFIVRSKVVPTVSLIFMLCVMVYLPSILSLIICVSSVLIAASYYIHTHYEIDYKYWLSFFGQLLALIFFVMSVLLVFIMSASLKGLY